MHRRVLLAAVMLTFCLAFSAQAATVTITITQNEKAPETALETSRTVEDELFLQFFSSGHIVSNSDIRFDGSLFLQKNYGLKEAAWGLSDYLVVVFLEFLSQETPEGSLPAPAQLVSVSWKVVQVADGIVLETKKLTGKETVIDETDPAKRSRILAQRLFPDILNTIAKARKGGS